MSLFNRRKSLKKATRSLETTVQGLRGKIYNVEQGLYSAQKQLNQLYRILWDYNHIVITHSEEEKNGLVQTGFVIIGESVYECFENSAEGFTLTQRRFYILKPQQLEKKAMAKDEE